MTGGGRQTLTSPAPPLRVQSKSEEIFSKQRDVTDVLFDDAVNSRTIES